MALSPSFSWEFASSCSPYYFEDSTCTYNAETCVSGYSSPNISKDEVTLTKIIVGDSHGNEWEYDGYLPTQGEVELIFENFTQTEIVESTTTDTGCGCTTETTESTNFEDGCYTITYEVYSGVGGVTLQGTTSTSLYFYCRTRNRIFDLITGSCSDCCDQEKQNAIWEIRNMYEDMLTVYNKVGCECAEGILAQIQKKLDKIEGNC